MASGSRARPGGEHVGRRVAGEAQGRIEPGSNPRLTIDYGVVSGWCFHRRKRGSVARGCHPCAGKCNEETGSRLNEGVHAEQGLRGTE